MPPPVGGVSATLPNGMTMRLPGGVYASEVPYALALSGGDAQAFAATAAGLSANPALASAVHQQAMLRQNLGARIAALERTVAARQRVVSAALYEVQRATRALALAHRDAYVSRSQLAAAHRQLAALDVNGRRLADAARLGDLRRALSLTQATLSPAAVMTESQRVVNAQLAAALRDQIAATSARVDAAGHEIDNILAANVTATAADLYADAEKQEAEAASHWASAQRRKAEADKANTVRAHVLAAQAHMAINAAGEAALTSTSTSTSATSDKDKSAAKDDKKDSGKGAAADAKTGAGAATASTPSQAAPAPAAPAAAAAPASFRDVNVDSAQDASHDAATDAHPEAKQAAAAHAELPRFQRIASRVTSRGSATLHHTVAHSMAHTSGHAATGGSGALRGRAAPAADAVSGSAGSAEGALAASRHVHARSGADAASVVANGLAARGAAAHGAGVSADAAAGLAAAAEARGRADAVLAATESLISGVSHETRLHAPLEGASADAE